MDQYGRNRDDDRSSAINDAYAQAKKNNRTSLIFFIIIVIAVFIYSSINGGGSIASECDAQMLGVAADAEHSVFVYYTDIQSVEYTDKFDMGTKLSGLDEENVAVGTFKNEEFGEYDCLCYNNVEQYIIVKHTDGVLVFNCSSKKLTEERYEILMEKLGMEIN